MAAIAAKRRSPQGERGLKLEAQKVLMIDRVSLSARRAWIEIGDNEIIVEGDYEVALRKESVD